MSSRYCRAGHKWAPDAPRGANGYRVCLQCREDGPSGAVGALAVALAAYRDAPPDERDGMFVRVLVDVLLSEAREATTCQWAGVPCDRTPVETFEGRRLCAEHRAAVLVAREETAARDS